ncbi:hypothetical protein RQP46_007919 [Phenoliferia psychrophenolica]
MLSRLRPRLSPLPLLRPSQRRTLFDFDPTQAEVDHPSRPAPSQVRPRIKIVEVGPRDGLQNEKAVLSTELKVELIRRLVGVGLRTVESGSFVSPKWVPQMATTTSVMTSPILASLAASHPSLSLPVLVPNAQGLTSFLSLPLPTLPNREIAIFVAASESFSKANLNCSIAESIARLGPVVERAKKEGIRVRGYVSVVAGCPFEGRVGEKEVASVVRELVGMGCYELSHSVPIAQLAAHCHDTYNTSIASILTCLTHGITTIDSSIAGLGGCPYSPGATGNVATEDVVYALESSGYSTGLLPEPMTRGYENDLLEIESARGRAFEELCEVGECLVTPVAAQLLDF